MKYILAIICLGLGKMYAQSLDPTHHVPVEKNLSEEWKQSLWKDEKTVYRGEQLKTIGMPCGGIAAGQLYVTGDGTLACWWIANNAYNTGYGVDRLMHFNTSLGPWKVCYQTFEPFKYVDQGFEITVRSSGKTVRRELSKKDFNDISFVGEYPVARINYASKSDPLPLKIDATVYSPFIPLNARESATPATILNYRLENTGPTPLEVSLTGWLQNMVCQELKNDAIGLSRNRLIKGKGMSSLVMDIVEDPAGEKYFPSRHPYFGNLALTIFTDGAFGDAQYTGKDDRNRQQAAEARLGEKLIGTTGATISLKPGESKELTFVVSWYFPNRPMNYGDGGNWARAIPTEGPAIGNMYANWFASSLDVAGWLKNNYDRLRKETFNFHDSYYNNTNIPYWLKQRLMMPVSTLATETCQWWSNNKFWAWEGVGSCVGTCTHVWNYEQALAHLFPELERNIREKTDFGTSFQEDGSVLARNGWGGVLIDGHAGAILKSYREHLHSPNSFFLSRNWEKIKKAIEFIIGEDGNSDGLLEKKQANTYDIAFYGANTYVGSLYLAALRAASQMAAYMGDSAFAGKCNDIFEKGSRLSAERLWNGEYFIQDVDLTEHPKFQYGKGCLSDQLFGQTWAHLYGLGYLYPKDKVQKALQSVWKYNWTPAVGVQTRIHPPERTFAAFDEPGLLVATWPFDKHMGEDGVRYRDEVWTGIEYQVATNMIYEGMTEEGLSLVKSIHERYSPEKHNPWNEIECGDHYARALASWGVLVALEGYGYNGPEKTIRFNPVKPGFAGFFTAAEGWGNFSCTQSDRSRNDEVLVKYGKLPLKQLILAWSTATPKKVKVLLNNTTVPASYKAVDGNFVISFDELTIVPGMKLSVSREY